MIVYTYTEARERLSEVLDRAGVEGAVRIQRRDGRSFLLRPEPSQARGRSPFDVPAVRGTGVTTADILDVLRESRARGDEPGKGDA